MWQQGCILSQQSQVGCSSHLGTVDFHNLHRSQQHIVTFLCINSNLINPSTVIMNGFKLIEAILEGDVNRIQELIAALTLEANDAHDSQTETQNEPSASADGIENKEESLIVEKKDTTCHLLRLPAEVRKLIYKEVFACGVFCHCKKDLHLRKSGDTVPKKEPHALGLVYVNRQIYHESLSYAYKTVTTCSNPSHAEGLLRLAALGDKGPLQHIKNLNISIYHRSKSSNCFLCGDCWFREHNCIPYMWDMTLYRLDKLGLRLESLSVHFVPHLVELGLFHYYDPIDLVHAISAMKSCKTFRFTGTFYRREIRSFVARTDGFQLVGPSSSWHNIVEHLNDNGRLYDYYGCVKCAQDVFGHGGYCPEPWGGKQTAPLVIRRVGE